MSNIQDLLKKKHVMNHPLFAHKQKMLNNLRKSVKKHAQQMEEEEKGMIPDTDDVFGQPSVESTSNDKKLSSLIRDSIVTTEEIFSQFDFPLPPKVSYNRVRDVKYSKINSNEVVSGIVVLNCKVATISGASKQLEIPVSIVRGQVIQPSILLYEGRMPVIAQSTIDEIVQRSTSYELTQMRGMYSPPLNQDERDISISMRNEMGWQPRNIGGMAPDLRRSGNKKAAQDDDSFGGAYGWSHEMNRQVYSLLMNDPDAYDEINKIIRRFVRGDFTDKNISTLAMAIMEDPLLEGLVDEALVRYDGDEVNNNFDFNEVAETILDDYKEMESNFSMKGSKDKKAAQDYGIRWSEFDKNDRVTNKEKFFDNSEARDKYADKLQEKDNFKEFLAWSDPDETKEANRHESKKATSTPSKVPGAYGVVVEKMQKAKDDGEDTFPRTWQYILRNYILKCINTADKDKWEIHLINDGWCINPWERGRRKRGLKTAQEDIWEGQEVEVLRGRHKGEIGTIVEIYEEDLEQEELGQVDVLLSSGETIYLEPSDVKPSNADHARRAQAQAEGGIEIEGDYFGRGPVSVSIVYSDLAPWETKFICISSNPDRAISISHNAWTDYQMLQDHSDIEAEIREENPKASDEKIYELLYEVVTENWGNILKEFSSKEDLLDACRENPELSEYSDAILGYFGEDEDETHEAKKAQTEAEEDYNLVESKCYNGTKMPIEPDDPVKFQGHSGSIRGTVVEVGDDEWVIVKSKGNEYRVHCEDVEPLNSTYKKKWAGKKADDGEHDDLFSSSSFYIIKDGVEVGSGVNLDDEPVYVGIVHDGSGYNPSAAVYIDQNKYHASEDSVLESAFEILQQITMDRMTPEDWKSLEKDAEELGVDSFELMTGRFDGFAIKMTPQELKTAIDRCTGRPNFNELSVVEFYEPEVYEDEEESEDEDFEKESRKGSEETENEDFCEKLPRKILNHYTTKILDVSCDALQNEWIKVTYEDNHLTKQDTWKVVDDIGWVIKFTDTI